MAATASLSELLEQRARSEPDRLAFRFLIDDTAAGAADLSYLELYERAGAIAAGLRNRGMTGNRVVLALEPGLDYITALFGIFRAGAVAVPSFPPARKREVERLRAVVADCAPELIIGGREGGVEFDGAPWLAVDALLSRDPDPADEPVEPGTTALLQYTSGSTGEPKGVMVTHGNLVANCEALEANLGPEEKRISCSWLPPYHDMGLIGAILLPIFGGFPMVLLSPARFVQQPYRWLKAITDHAVTTSVTPNFAFDLCVDAVTDDELAGLDLRSLRHLFCGSEPLLPATLDRFVERFGPCGYTPDALVPCFGMAEATLFVSGRDRRAAPVTRLALDKRALAQGEARQPSLGAPNVEVVSCGAVAPEHEALVVDPDTRQPLPPGKVGELWLRGPSVAAGYFGKPELSAATFGAILADGHGGARYLRTGDLGFIHDGELYVTGRLNDLIIIAGRNHYPQDIEVTVRRAYPAARQVAAFPVSHGGAEQLVVVVEAKRVPDWAQPRTEINAAVAAAHGVRPADVHFGPAGAVALTTSGKVRRAATKAAYLDGSIKRFPRRASQPVAAR